MKIAIASDHRGYELKQKLIKELDNNYQICDYGTNSNDSVDYPIYAFKVAESIKNNECDFGILLCGSGIGMSIAANKVKNVRCAKVSNKNEAFFTRQHNNANIIALSANLDFNNLLEIVTIFLTTPFSNEERHIKRNNMVDNYEN